MDLEKQRIEGDSLRCHYAGIESFYVSHLEDTIFGRGAPDKIVSFLQGAGDRFFQQHVHAPLKSPASHLGVVSRGNHNAHGLDRAQSLVKAAERLHTQFLCQLSCAFRAEVVYANQLRSR